MAGPAEDIAVIGLACLFPGAPDVATFWRNIVGKVDAISDPPPEAWDPSLYFDPQADDNDRLYCRKGGYLGALAQFDPLEYGIVPRAIEGGEPDQWLALHVAREALRDAGYDSLTQYRERSALILGKGTYANRGTLSMIQHAILVDYTLDILKSVQPGLSAEDLRRVRADLKRRLPRFDAETAPALIPNVTVGRIANRLDVMGPSYTVDAACASSLVAIDIAVKGLRQGEYDVALVGGLQVATPHPVLSLFCQLRALSASERIRPFDKDADGTLLSEGLGMALLKRRTRAEADGDRIYAVIKGTGVASDGRAVGVLAPRVEGEELALRRAYADASVAPGTVALIEAHGTGTLVGDAVEIEALSRVFGGRTGWPRCAVGSVKSNIGHTMPAAGMAGFIKAVLSLYHRVLPPTINVAEPSPRLGIERTPFYINTETRPWIHAHSGSLRRAGVNSFGFGGINAHVVLEEAEHAGASYDTVWDSEVCVLGGGSRGDIREALLRLKDSLGRCPGAPLADVARAVNLQAGPHEKALSIVAESTEDLARKIDRALVRLGDPAVRKIKDPSGIYYFDEPLGRSGTLAFLFPGEGSQYPNMLADLCRHFGSVRACFDRINRVFTEHPRGFLLSDFLYPPPLSGQNTEGARALFDMDVAVEAVLTANHALHLLLKDFGITPDALLGHSTGEFSAFRAAGMFADGDEELILALNKIYRFALDADRVPEPVDLIAIGAGREPVEALCQEVGGGAAVAMDNCRHQVVMAVKRTASAAAQALCRNRGLLYEVLSFDRPYHTPMFEAFADGMREFFVRWIVSPPATALYSCTTGGLYPATLPEIRRVAVDHWTSPVEFRRTIEQMHADGVRLFVEVGPRGNLSAFVDDVLGRREYAAIPANVSRRSGISQLHHLLGLLAAHGRFPVLAPLYSGRRLGTFELDHSVAVPRKRTLGPVKIPTGASEMRLSPEALALVRAARSDDPVVAPKAVAAVDVPAVPRVERDAPSRVPPPSSERAVSSDVAAPTSMPSSYFDTMADFLSLQQEFLSVALQSDRSRPAASAPFIDAIVSRQPGQSLVARGTLDLARCPFLRDHTIGRDVADSDPALTGLPIVPFTALTEMMAEAALLLSSGRVVVGMSDVRVDRWVAIDEPPLTLELHAEQIDADAARVRVLEVGAEDRGPVAEGIIRLGVRYPDAPAAEPFSMPDAVPFHLAPAHLYETAMFHGPLFRGVASVDRVSQAGASATVQVLDRGAASANAAGWATDFILLDQPGQVVGFWAAQCLEDRSFVLPIRLRSLRLFGPMLPVGETLTCLARVGVQGDAELTSTLDLVRADGRLWARFEGWDDRRFDLIPQARQTLLQPRTARLAEPWRLPGLRADLVGFRIGLDTFPRGWLNAHGGLWRHVIAAVALGRRERDVWRGLKVPESRRIEWLFGRIAAKDAVREYLRRRNGIDVKPADVEVLPDADGRPVVSAQLPDGVRPPLVSISHVDGVAMAVVGDDDMVSGVGVDLERRGRMNTSMEAVAFSDRERGILGEFAGTERQLWSTRFWCAKEAFSKATGCAVSPLSRLLAVERVDREQGTVTLRYEPAGQSGITLPVSTAHDGDWVVATCVGLSDATGVQQ